MSDLLKGLRSKLRIHTASGVLSIEEVCQLSLVKLEAAIRETKKQLAPTEDTDLDFLSGTVKQDPIQQLTFNILKEIYTAKKAESTEITNKRANDEHNAKIMEAISRIEDQEFNSLGKEELLKMMK